MLKLSTGQGADLLNTATTQTLYLWQTGVSTLRPEQSTRSAPRCDRSNTGIHRNQQGGVKQATGFPTTRPPALRRRDGAAPLGTTESSRGGTRSRPPRLGSGSARGAAGQPSRRAPGPRHHSARLQTRGEAREAPARGDRQMSVTTLVFSGRSALLKRKIESLPQDSHFTFKAGAGGGSFTDYLRNLYKEKLL